MNSGLPIVRLLAAMIFAIVAWAAPSAAGAHEGHTHAGHPRAAPVVVADAAPLPVIAAEAAALMRSPAFATSASVDMAGSVRSDDSERWDGRGLHGICCCGATCCAPGILAAPVVLPGPARRNAVLRAYDAPAHAGFDPEALTEPPRLLA